MKHQYYCKNCGYQREGLLDHQAIGIGSYSTTCPECGSSYKSYVPHLEYYTVENTGWSNGISWFKTGGTDANPLRFDTKEEAINHALALKEYSNNTLWRIVHTTVEKVVNKETITREYHPL